MLSTSSAFEQLVSKFSQLPGIGKKTAQRLTLYILKMPREDVFSFAQALEDVKTKVRLCSQCWNFTESELCELCSNIKRDNSLICVVEEPRDVLLFEKTNAFRGVYHVLGGVLSPLDDIGPEDLKIRELLSRINGHTKEVILALNPTIEGETTILYLTKCVKPLGVTVSRIARGIPVGGEMEFLDEATLSSALSGRVVL
ncbi:MAG: recombination mediator RecR [Ignavibacteriales bacterium]|nr:recombination mediator RecR [Ignavibacteriales bacterium]